MSGDRRKATDYAGIAALITAIGTIVFGLWNQNTDQLVQESGFAVLQYRLHQAELEIDACHEGVRLLENFHPAVDVYRKPPVASSAPVSADASPEKSPSEGESGETPQSPREVIVGKTKRRQAVSFKELQSYVQKEDRSLTLEDF